TPLFSPLRSLNPMPFAKIVSGLATKSPAEKDGKVGATRPTAKDMRNITVVRFIGILPWCPSTCNRDDLSLRDRPLQFVVFLAFTRKKYGGHRRLIRATIATQTRFCVCAL